MKKMPGGIVILQMRTINDNRSRDMECDRQNFLSFWTLFFPFFWELSSKK